VHKHKCIAIVTSGTSHSIQQWYKMAFQQLRNFDFHIPMVLTACEVDGNNCLIRVLDKCCVQIMTSTIGLGKNFEY